MKNENPGCLAALLQMIGLAPKPSISSSVPESNSEKVEIPYKLRDDFLSEAEASFYHVVKGMMGDYFTICPKISLSEIVYVPRRVEGYQAYLNQINRKHVDFLICEAKTMQPRFAIELDDSSHQREDRARRDEFVDKVLDAAGLPLVRIPVSNAYDTHELGARFRVAVEGKLAEQTTPEVSSGSPEDTAPFCPNCGERMVVREARRGAKIGRKFYGCPNYPRCKTIIPIEISV